MPDRTAIYVAQYRLANPSAKPTGLSWDTRQFCLFGKLFPLSDPPLANEPGTVRTKGL